MSENRSPSRAASIAWMTGGLVVGGGLGLVAGIAMGWVGMGIGVGLALGAIVGFIGGAPGSGDSTDEAR
ncbi:hypothetical protein [Leucobacter chromiireducens]|uniref:hypothetical protein n=1 Tax=Leucobacter chromiireducens TaxID=283877 RepID=UPI000F641C82|nr:hypothetical protein [Leucobacter chromiireducens]